MTLDGTLQQNLLDAVNSGDWDRALQLGLMEIELDPADSVTAPLLQLQIERRVAFAARARYEAKRRRESIRARELADKRAARAVSAADAPAAALPSAAQLALQRALQRVKAKQI